MIADANKIENIIANEIASKIPVANAIRPTFFFVTFAATGMCVSVSSKPVMIFTRKPEIRYFITILFENELSLYML